MCGIAGQIGRTASLAPSVGDSIWHRGPECGDSLTISAGHDRSVRLFHRRLRIIDLSDAGRQPMTRGSYTVVFNGEIYNFLELRRILEGDGYQFTSSSDTEVILHAYARWGLDSIAKLHGMFVFALWDDRTHELVLARDRIGKKPLFYYQGGETFAFGSEIKAVLAALGRTPDIDPEAVDDYLTYLYVPYPRTIFKGIRQLPPASWMRLKLPPGAITTSAGSYWDPFAAAPSPGASVRTLRSQLQNLIADSVRSRLISDVPLGVLLSGGLDSSSITAMMARASSEPVRSFSIGFPQHRTYDEITYAKRIADYFGSEHEVLEAEPSCSSHLAKIIWHFDQPFGNPTAVLTYVLSALTKRSVTVALAGDGGDELFGGYPRYIGAYLSRLPRALPGFVRNTMLPALGNALTDDSNGRHQFRRLREFLSGAGMPLIDMYLGWIGYFSQADKDRLYSPDMARTVAGRDAGQFLRALYAQSEGLEPLNRLAYVDSKSFLCCNVLEYADRMSMAHALELRAPFTDHRLVEFSLHVPFSLKFRYGESKWLLKQVMKPFLPADVLNKRKLGFNPPLGSWLNGELRALPKTLLSRERVLGRGLFHPDAISRLLEQHWTHRRDNSLHIWALLMLDIWWSIYMDGRSVDSVQDEIDVAIADRDRVQIPSTATA